MTHEVIPGAGAAWSGGGGIKAHLPHLGEAFCVERSPHRGVLRDSTSSKLPLMFTLSFLWPCYSLGLPSQPQQKTFRKCPWQPVYALFSLFSYPSLSPVCCPLWTVRGLWC